MSASQRAKISAALKGRKLSAATRAKISAALKGRKVSEETKAKIRAGLKRYWASPAGQARIASGNLFGGKRHTWGSGGGKAEDLSFFRQFAKR